MRGEEESATDEEESATDEEDGPHHARHAHCPQPPTCASSPPQSLLAVGEVKHPDKEALTVALRKNPVDSSDDEAFEKQPVPVGMKVSISGEAVSESGIEYYHIETRKYHGWIKKQYIINYALIEYSSDSELFSEDEAGARPAQRPAHNALHSTCQGSNSRAK